MRHLIACATVVFVLAGCAPAAAPEQPASNNPSASPTATQQPAAVAAVLIAGDGLSSEGAGGEPVDAVEFAAGPDAVAAFLTEALGVEPTHPDDLSDCIASFSVTLWGEQDAGIELRVPSSIDPPVLDYFVITGASSVNGIDLRSSTGFAVGDDVSAIPETLPAAQTVGLRDSLGWEDPMNFVFDPAGTFNQEGVEYAYGGSVQAEKGIAVRITSPRPSARSLC